MVQGDTFNAIAYANDMSVSDLEALNPGVDINRLMVGDVLNVKELTPVLSVQTVDNITYTESIECPVETKEDSSMYKGETKIITQGVEGEAQVNATVTYVNGQETERVINSSVTVREPTTTVKAVGTKEKPKTASTGSYSWPITGRITSYFAGGTSSAATATIPVLTFPAPTARPSSGRRRNRHLRRVQGQLRYLVIITHDNGTQTYYAHNSSCWCPRDRRCTRDSRSPRRAAPAGPPAPTATLRCG